MKTLRAGIVGVGKIGAAQIEALQRLGCAEVRSIVVRDETRARALCDRYGIREYHSDYTKMLADPEIDVVHDCTPNREHFAINRDAILAGKAVLSEKPLTISSAESAELVRLSKSHNAFTAVNFVYRHYKIVQRLRDMIAAGELGTIRAVRGYYLQDWLLYESDYDWRVEAARGGPSRAMADIGTHWCDLARFLTGQEITEVCADLAVFIPERTEPATQRRVHVDTEDYASALLRFSGGARGSFTVSQVSAGQKTGLSIEVDGSEASVRWSRQQAESLWIGRRDRPAEIVTLDPPESQQQIQMNMIESFYARILEGGTRRYANFSDGHAMAQVVEAILESHSTRTWQKV
jgi:predicted dehydrogenase